MRVAIEKTRHCVGVSGVDNVSPKDHTGLDATSLVAIEVRDGKWTLIE